ncbi:MAG: TRAP transporter small permease subunit, partial [Bacteroidota bacterium]
RKQVDGDVFSGSLSPKAKLRMDLLIEMVIFVFTVLILIIGGSRFVWITFKLGQISSTLHIMKGWIYLAIPLSGLCTLGYITLNVRDILKPKQ